MSTPSLLNFSSQAADSGTLPIVESAMTTFTLSPLEYFKFSSNNFAADLAIFIVCSSNEPLTSKTPFLASIVGLIPITGYPPINLLFAIQILSYLSSKFIFF